MFTWLAVFVVVAALSCLRAPYPEQMYLQHLPTLAAVALLAVAARRRTFSRGAFLCMLTFMALHVLGARYIYSYVPYDQWAERIAGLNLTAAFGFRRNHYDRLVHFAFGLLAVLPAWEILTRRLRVTPRLALYFCVEFVLAFSLLYELFEWALTIVLSPEDAGAYNGEQGDIWDAHRDMSCAFAGSLLAAAILRVRRL